MRKIVSILLACVMVIGLAGCGSKADSSVSDGSVSDPVASVAASPDVAPIVDAPMDTAKETSKPSEAPVEPLEEEPVEETVFTGTIAWGQPFHEGRAWANVEDADRQSYCCLIDEEGNALFHISVRDMIAVGGDDDGAVAEYQYINMKDGAAAVNRDGSFWIVDADGNVSYTYQYVDSQIAGHVFARTPNGFLAMYEDKNADIFTLKEISPTGDVVSDYGEVFQDKMLQGTFQGFEVYTLSDSLTEIWYDYKIWLVNHDTQTLYAANDAFGRSCEYLGTTEFVDGCALLSLYVPGTSTIDGVYCVTEDDFASAETLAAVPNRSSLVESHYIMDIPNLTGLYIPPTTDDYLATGTAVDVQGNALFDIPKPHEWAYVLDEYVVVDHSNYYTTHDFAGNVVFGRREVLDANGGYLMITDAGFNGDVLSILAPNGSALEVLSGFELGNGSDDAEAFAGLSDVTLIGPDNIVVSGGWFCYNRDSVYHNVVDGRVLDTVTAVE